MRVIDERRGSPRALGALEGVGGRFGASHID
jgi:hypothetical protein